MRVASVQRRTTPGFEGTRQRVITGIHGIAVGHVTAGRSARIVAPGSGRSRRSAMGREPWVGSWHPPDACFGSHTCSFVSKKPSRSRPPTSSDAAGGSSRVAHTMRRAVRYARHASGASSPSARGKGSHSGSRRRVSRRRLAPEHFAQMRQRGPRACSRNGLRRTRAPIVRHASRAPPRRDQAPPWCRRPSVPPPSRG